MKIKSLLRLCVIIMISITAIFYAGCFGLDSDISGSAESSFEIVGETSCNYEYNEYLGYTCEISGVLKNKTSSSYSYVSIEFSVYDANGNNIGTAIDNVNNIGAGETWRFTATLLDFPDSRPASYKLKDITAW